MLDFTPPARGVEILPRAGNKVEEQPGEVKAVDRDAHLLPSVPRIVYLRRLIARASQLQLEEGTERKVNLTSSIIDAVMSGTI